MATRPIFLPFGYSPHWRTVDVDFEWFSGFAVSQRQRSIASLHHIAVSDLLCSCPLEVSSRSPLQLGVQLSAFNLKINHNNLGSISLESAFQGSKVFERAGHLKDVYSLNSRNAKAAARNINAADHLIGFRWNGVDWPLEPKTWFYDWLYMSAILDSFPEATNEIRKYDAFTDIEFNPAKSFNCQARSCAIIASTLDDAELRSMIDDPQTMIRSVPSESTGHQQKGLW